MWEDYGYIMASKYRKFVLLALLDHPKTPKEIAKETRLNISHVSRALREMHNKAIVKCMTPNRLKGRVYCLTNKGIHIAKIIKGNESYLNSVS